MAPISIRRASVDDLPNLPGLVIDVTAYIATDDAGRTAGFVVAAFHSGVATILQSAGPADVQAALAEHVGAQRDFFADSLVIVPRASEFVPKGAYVALSAPRVAEAV